MEKDIIELHESEFFRPGEQVYIHVDAGNSPYDGVMHKHDFIEIAYVISGKAAHRLGNMEYTVSRGDLAIVNCGTPHTFIPRSDADETFATYDLLFTPKFFEVKAIGGSDFAALASSYLFYSVFAENLPENSLNLIHSSHCNFEEVIRKIYDEYNERCSGFTGVIRAHLIELIIKIFRELDYRSHREASPEQLALVEQAIEYMKKNYNSHIDLDKITSDIFLSKNYFRQMFKSVTGMTITDFIQNTRVEEAKKRLAYTDETTAEIADNCGFSDLTFFYRIFKKKTGQTPGEYRKNNSN